jgi:hypothetical protein
MNRQDTNLEDQKADDQLANLYFGIRLISNTKQKVIQCKKNFYAWEICPHSNLPCFINKTWTSLVSPCFMYIKPRPCLPRTCCPVPNLSVLLILNKCLQVINVSFLQRKPLHIPSKIPVRDVVHLHSLTLSGSF